MAALQSSCSCSDFSASSLGKCQEAGLCHGVIHSCRPWNVIQRKRKRSTRVGASSPCLLLSQLPHMAVWYLYVQHAQQLPKQGNSVQNKINPFTFCFFLNTATEYFTRQNSTQLFFRLFTSVGSWTKSQEKKIYKSTKPQTRVLLQAKKPLKVKQNYLHVTKMQQAFLISVLVEKQTIKSSPIFDLSCRCWERKPSWQKEGMEAEDFPRLGEAGFWNCQNKKN